jgi:hypothetical protein
VGTTVAPWQLFFQQSNVVDKRITPRWISYERADTVIGSFAVVIGAVALIAVTASGFAGTRLHGHFTNAGAVAAGLEHTVGHHAGALFAVLLLDASLIGAAAITLATSYALGDMAGARHSLDRSISEAPLFYGLYAFFLAAAAAVVLIPGVPLGLITEGVQALAGILLPAATVILILLCNDKEILGPWVNKPWLNAVAGSHCRRPGTAIDDTHGSHPVPAPDRPAARRDADWRGLPRPRRCLRLAGIAVDLGTPAARWPCGRGRRGRGAGGGTAHLADAAARSAPPAGLVARAQARHDQPALLSGRCRGASDRQGGAARRRALRLPRSCGFRSFLRYAPSEALALGRRSRPWIRELTVTHGRYRRPASCERPRCR